MMEDLKKLVIDKTDKMYLSLLPNEILLHIFGMLPPLSLLAVGRSDQSFLPLTCDRMLLQNIDFSKCSSISLQDLSDFFIPARAAFISELNFDDCKWIGSSHLEECIEKCERMHTLNVRNCDLTLTAIFRILTKLKHLINLSWTVSIDDPIDREKYSTAALTETLSNLKRVSLEFRSINYISQFVILWDYVLPSCNNLKELVVNFMLVSSPEYDSTIELMDRIILRSLDCLTVVCNCGHIGHHFDYDAFGSIARLLYNAKIKGKKWKKLWICHYLTDYVFNIDEDYVVVNEMDIKDFNRVECLQINCATNITAEVLKNVPRGSVHTLGVYKSQFELLESNAIIEACGKKLKRFVSKYYKRGTPQVPFTYLQDFFTACCNITELNIQGIHFGHSSDSPCTAICNLKSLKRLILSECAVISVSKRLTEDFVHTRNHKKKLKIPNPFQDMVENCEFVKEFTLHGCHHPPCYSYCSDEDIEAIYLWRKLEYLRLIVVSGIEGCKFLEKIALHCKTFKSLGIIWCGDSNDCLYIESLKFLLVNAHSLSSLKIAARDFVLGSSNIWHSISRAENLERICLFIPYFVDYNPLDIRKSISRLTKLRLFHLFCDEKELNREFLDGLERIKEDFESRKQGVDLKADLEFAVGCKREHECPFTCEIYVNGVADPLLC